jgi:ABC-type antimicrobial peptide transport system permease subunit
MIKNYFKIAIRNLLKNKTSSFINISGLAVGMAVTLLIALWIWDELAFNKYHENYDRIAQVMEKDIYNANVNASVAIPLPLYEEMRKSYGSDFKHIVMASWTGSHVLSVGDKKISYTGNYMGSEGPEMFTLHMQKGTRSGLSDPASMLISQSVAVALFGNADPINKLVKFDNAASFKVAGVYDDLPPNTRLHDIAFMVPWDFYVSSKDWVQRAKTKWNDNSFQMYVQVADHVDMAKLSEKIKNIKLNRVSKEDAKSKPVIFLQPMSRWHLYAEFKNGVNTGGAIEYVWLFGIIGVFVLLLACINFMNLSTARSEKRAKEVGIRKAIGSLRVQLISQFFCESLLMAFCAFVFSLLLALLALPFFNEVADKQVVIPWSNPLFWLISSGFTVFTGLISGIYPALYLSSFRPVKVLKGTFQATRFAAIPRKVLVVVQFTVSIALIIATIIVFKQILFAKDRPIGYSSENLVNIGTTDELEDHFNTIRADFLKSRSIVELAESSSPLTAVHNARHDVSWNTKDPSMTSDFANIRVTSEYGKTVGWQFVTGRDFDKQLLTDSSAVILNQAAVKYMGFKNPVGEIIRFNNKDHVVIGVVKDMVMTSPYDPAKQTIFYLDNSDFDNIIIRINPKISGHDAISKIAAVFKTYSPAVPLSYNFVDDDYAKKFNSEERIGDLATVFAALAIFISCLGLFGMASFMTEQRVKEIGVRKVLGASVFKLWQLLSNQFVKLVLISLLIAIPAAYYFMHNWLQNYQYRTELSWWIFAAAGTGSLLITLLTVSFQAVKAAIANPVKSLRTE